MNKPVCLGLSIVDIRKIVMYDYWQDICKTQIWKDNVNMDSFVVQDLAGDVKKRFYASNYEVK